MMFPDVIVTLALISLVPVFGEESTTVFGYEATTAEEATVTPEIPTVIATESTTVTTTTFESTTQLEPNNDYTPFQVSLHYSYNDDFICGGSIISFKMVLTSAHCLYYRWGGLMPPLIVNVAAGKLKLNETAWKVFNVAKITLHPSFNKTAMQNDLALLEIEDRFETDNLIGQINVTKQISDVEYNNCVVTGWNQNTNEFQVMEVVLSSCTSYPERICTIKKYQDNTICINNAGNPLVCNNELIGVLSVEPNCEDPAQPAIFEDIRYSMDWLDKIVNGASNRIQIKLDYLLVIYFICKYIL